MKRRHKDAKLRASQLITMMELTQRSAPSGSAQVRKFHLPPALSIISLQQSKMQDVEQKLQPYIFAPELSPSAVLKNFGSSYNNNIRFL